MSVVFNEEFAGLGVGTILTGRAIAGTSYTWTNTSGGAHGLVGAAGGGLLPATPTTNNQLGQAYFTALPFGEITWRIDPQSSTVANTVFFLCPTIAEKNSNSIAIEVMSTSISIRRVGGPSPGTLGTLTGLTDPGAPHKLSFYADFPTKVVRVRRLTDAGVVISELERTLPDNFPASSVWVFGYNFAAAPIMSVFRSAVYDNLASGAAAPVYTGGSVTATGKYSANITFSSNQAGGEAFYTVKTVNTTPTQTEMLVGKFSSGVVSGTNTLPVSGLAAGTTYYVFLMPRGAGKDIGVVTSVGSFTTNPATAIPVFESVSVVATGGDSVQVTATFTSEGGPVDGVTVSLPVDTVPQGAVDQPPGNMVNTSGTTWRYTFTGVPSGNYDTAALVARNADHPMVLGSGNKKVKLLLVSGNAQA